MPVVDQVSPSERLIAPEIVDDWFYQALQWLAALEPINHILEIGSSAGAGSTRAFVDGIALNPARPSLYCIEISKPRFQELAIFYSGCNYVKPYNVSSVSADCYPTDQEVIEFYRDQKTALNQYPLDLVLGWKAEGLRYLHETGVEQSGIATIKKENHIDRFDLVLIDGGEFTGYAELLQIYGAKIICLDDINTFKCFAARQKLLEDQDYELVLEDFSVRNGFSIFIRKDFPSRWLHLNRVTEGLLRQSGRSDTSLSGRDWQLAALNDRLHAWLTGLERSRVWRMTAILRQKDDRDVAKLSVGEKLERVFSTVGSLSWTIAAILRLPSLLLRRLRLWR